MLDKLGTSRIWVLAAIVSMVAIAPPAYADHFRVQMQDLLDAMSVSASGEVAEEIALTQQFYGARLYEPLWVADDGLTPNGRILTEHLFQSDRHGLRPSDYQVDEIRSLMGAPDPQSLADLELSLTRMLFRYGQDVNAGRVAPNRVNPELFLQPKRIDKSWLLSSAASTPDMAAFLDGLAPHSSQYQRTVETLAKYREIAALGGWEKLPDGETLKPGMRDPRVPILRQRLIAAGDFKDGAPVSNTAAASSDPEFYDPQLEAAVKWFQYRHGLEQDGAVGKKTQAAFNVPVEDRIDTLILNLERRRWLPDDLGDRYIFVNMAGFELKLVEKDSTVFDTRVVVGTPFHRTPVFSADMTYVVINPYWNITPSIARNEILPAVKKNVNYLANKNIRVFSDWSANAHEISPYTIDWSHVSANGLTYKFRQDAGDDNALGRVKFIFPNAHSVYLHDTPSKSLFARAKRSFSHGCIRVQNPLDLAVLVLGDMPEWSRQHIDEVVASGKRTIVNLDHPIPVYLTYLTNWVNKDGSVYFREDIYGRDALLAEALAGPRA
jgi:murein L,D-transpeptidase YcbB/YkuD